VRWVWVSLALIACGDSSKDLVTKNKAAIEGQLAKLRTLSADVDKRPPIENDALEVPAGTKLDFQHNGNTQTVYPGYLTDPCAGKEIHWVEEGREPTHETQILVLPYDRMSSWLIEPACILLTGKGQYGGEMTAPDNVKMELEALAKVKFVLVPRLEFKRPTYNIDEDGKVRTFNPGTITGDALVYDLTTAKYLGGFTLAATNANEVEDSSHSVFTSLQNELIDQTNTQIRDKLQKLAPETSAL
jgi:hypothetical protein